MRKQWKQAAIILALAALSVSCQAIPFFAPTPTPTATNTPTPTNTPTITPSPTATNTPTPTFTPTPTPIAFLESLEDGSQRFVDLEGGYELVFPEDWLVLNLLADDLDALAEETVAAYPEFETQIDAVVQMNSLIALRAYALDTNPDHRTNSQVPNLNILLQPKTGTTTLPLDMIMDTSETLLTQVYKGLEIEKTEIRDNENGVKVGVIKSHWSLGELTGTEMEVDLLQAMLLTSKGTLTITITVPQGFYEELEPTFDALLDSINLLES